MTPNSCPTPKAGVPASSTLVLGPALLGNCHANLSDTLAGLRAPAPFSCTPSAPLPVTAVIQSAPPTRLRRSQGRLVSSQPASLSPVTPPIFPEPSAVRPALCFGGPSSACPRQVSTEEGAALGSSLSEPPAQGSHLMNSFSRPAAGRPEHFRPANRTPRAKCALPPAAGNRSPCQLLSAARTPHSAGSVGRAGGRRGWLDDAAPAGWRRR